MFTPVDRCLACLARIIIPVHLHNPTLIINELVWRTTKLTNIGAVLKQEISRLTRKELRSETQSLKKASVQYRAEIAALKRRTVALEQQLSRLAKTISNNVGVKADSEVTGKVRFTAKGFKSLRQRLGLSAMEIGTLLDVSAPTIYNWEAGNSSPRSRQLERIVVLRGMGKREIRAILQNLSK